jgi:hypothetical protein
MAMQMALQAGCHRVGYEHEYHAFSYSKSPSDERIHTKIWRCWCFVHALLSCELGMPCLIPFDALELKTCEQSTLPADFISKLRIVLYVGRINDLLGGIGSKDGRKLMRMILLVEKDLQSLASELRKAPANWSPAVEFIYLSKIFTALRNLISNSFGRCPLECVLFLFALVFWRTTK